MTQYNYYFLSLGTAFNFAAETIIGLAKRYKVTPEQLKVLMTELHCKQP